MRRHTPWVAGTVALVIVLALALGGARLTHRSIFRHSAAGSVAGPPGSTLNQDNQPGASAANAGVATSPADSASPPGSATSLFISVHPTVTATATAPAGRNVAASSLGGEILAVSGSYGGPGLSGETLIDGTGKQIWQPDTAVVYPQDITFAFYKQDTALVSAVVISYAVDSSKGPSAVEIWTTTDSTPTHFKQIAAARLADTMALQAISFTPIEARYVKLRIDSGATNHLAMSQIRIIEGSRPGYTSLLERHPDIQAWGTSVRHAAQRGIDWLEPQAMQWQHEHNCFGCHVQAQTMMGLGIAQTNNYLVDAATMRALADFTRVWQDSTGAEKFTSGGPQTPTQFASMGMAYYDQVNGTQRDSALLRYVDWMTTQIDSQGAFPQDWDEAPIAQGRINSTANAIVAYMEAYAQTTNNKYKVVADRGVGFIAGDAASTTQDKVFKIIALERFGTPAQRHLAAEIVRQLEAEQRKDGSWSMKPGDDSSDAFSTGQVLYGFKEAGVDVQSPSFSRGVRYLLDTQDSVGAWPPSPHSNRPSSFAPTMWAVIGLAGTVQPPNTDSLKSALDKFGKLVLYIDFDFNKATLRPDAKPVITQVLALLQKYPDLKLTINGYTDSVGTRDYNVKLSQDRAAAVVAALVADHVKSDRLSSGGFGWNSPIADNKTEKGRAKNRRVELVKE